MKKRFYFLLGVIVAFSSLIVSCEEPIGDSDSDNDTSFHNGHEFIDLGLSVKWATCNVGAITPEEYGGYYAWGETEEKEYYDSDTYKWYNSSYNTLTKYCIDSIYGSVDNKTFLDPEDDVAHVKWGGSWRMPTVMERDELLDNCTWIWTTRNGVHGFLVTGPNGNNIFLPAAGYRYCEKLFDSGSCGGYWSSALYYAGDLGAVGLYFLESGYDWDINDRYIGRSVRPVCE